MTTMKAVRIQTYGGPDVVAYEDAPIPTPGANEVLVKIHAAGVNPVDWKIREGGLRFLNHAFPLTLGCDLAGTVEAVGAEAAAFKPGDAVYGYVNLARCGAFAEYALAFESELAPKPPSLDFAAACAVPVAALTSWQAMFDLAGLRAGQKVLIHAAAGGVGSIGVQLAKAKGAYVIGTASARNTEFVKGLGCDEVIDYQATRFEDAVQDIDVVFDTVGGDTQTRSFSVLKSGGALVSAVHPPSRDAATARGLTSTMVSVKPNGGQLADITALIETGKIKTHVETVLPLAEARQALALSEAGRTRGKIVLQIR